MLPTPGAPIELAEYCERPLTLTSVQAHHLTSVAKHRLGVAPEVGVDQWRIRATSYVGTIVIPGLKLLVTPKVSTANLFHLLEAGGKALEVGVEQFEYDRHHDLLAAISTFYARHLERAIGLGLSRSYVEHEDRLATIRGRIDLPAQRRAVGLPLPVSCRFDEHTPDIPLNRIVRAAAMRLLSVADVTRSTREALVSLIGRFVEVGDVRSTDLRQPTIFTRLNEHWRPAERLARLVLEGSSLQGATGATSAGVFLVDMNQLFEKFVEVRLQRELRPALTVSGQQPGHLDVCHEAGIRPDLTFVERSGAIVYVGDTKYKVTTDGYARDSDYYQLLAYVTALGLQEGVLVYCQDDGNPPPQQIEVRHGGHRLRTWAIRLDGSPRDVDAGLRCLARDIVRRVVGASGRAEHLQKHSRPG